MVEPKTFKTAHLNNTSELLIFDLNENQQTAVPKMFIFIIKRHVNRSFWRDSF